YGEAEGTAGFSPTVRVYGLLARSLLSLNIFAPDGPLQRESNSPCWRDMTESKPNLGRCTGHGGSVSHAHEHSDFARVHQSMTEPCCQEFFWWWSRAALSR